MSLLIKNGYCMDEEREGYFDIFIEGAKIARVGKDLIGADEVIDASDCLVFPAFCNAHTHLAMSLFRGMADDLELMEWLTKHIFPAEARHVSKQMVYLCSKLSMAELIRTGSGCFMDMYFYEEEVARAAEEIGIRGVIGEGIVGFETPSCKTPDEAISKTRSLKKEFSGSEYIRVSYAPHSTYTLSEETLMKVADALEEGDIVHIHVNESKREIDLVLSQKSRRPIDVLKDTGLLTGETYLAHSVETDRAEMALIKEVSAKVIHVPESNLKLSSGIAPVQEFIDNGIDVFLGTDGPASNNNQDLLEEARVASLVQKVKYNEKALDAKTAFRLMVNYNGLFNSGRIQEGKLADIVVMKLDGIEAVPIYNPYSFLIYAANSRDIRDVIINGKLVLRNGEFVSLDIQELKFKIRELAKKLGAI